MCGGVAGSDRFALFSVCTQPVILLEVLCSKQNGLPKPAGPKWFVCTHAVVLL